MNQPWEKLPLPEQVRAFARELRAGQTDAETLLWGALRARRLAELKFRRQHPVTPYTLDFYCDELHWAVELDGGQHNTAEGRSHDAERTAFLAAQGITVTRYWNHEVLGDFETVLEAIYNVAMRMRAANKNARPVGEGGDDVAG